MWSKLLIRSWCGFLTCFIEMIQTSGRLETCPTPAENIFRVGDFHGCGGRLRLEIHNSLRGKMLRQRRRFGDGGPRQIS
jgi:hypothetical protein